MKRKVFKTTEAAKTPAPTATRQQGFPGHQAMTQATAKLDCVHFAVPLEQNSQYRCYRHWKSSKAKGCEYHSREELQTNYQPWEH